MRRAARGLLYPRKGAVAPGSDADFAILDPTRSTVIENSQQLSKADYTRMQGCAISSRVEVSTCAANASPSTAGPLARRRNAMWSAARFRAFWYKTLF